MAVNPPSTVVAILIVLCFLSVLVAANSIGMLVATASRSSGEGHLIAILATLLVAGISGLFSVSPSATGFSWGMILPFRHLADVLQIGTGAYAPDSLALVPLSVFVLIALVFALSSRLIRRY